MKKNKLAFLLAIILMSTSVPVNVYATPEEVTALDGETAELEETFASSGLNKTLLSLGYHEMTLSTDDLKEKREVAREALAMQSLEAGVDYADNRVMYFADSEEEAESVANCYNAELVYYQYGVAAARVNFDRAEKAVENDASLKGKVPSNLVELLTLSGDTSNRLPAVHYDGIYKVDATTADSGKQYLVQSVQAETSKANKTAKTNEAAVTTGFSECGLTLDTGDAFTNAQYYHKYINDYEAWNQGITGEGVTVAVIDTGINSSHVDLTDCLAKVSPYNAIAGELDYEMYYDEPNPYTDCYDATDDHGHGTNCSAIVAATKGNGEGGCGVAPGAKIIPIKSLDSYGSGLNSWSIAGIRYAIQNNADVLSMSIGGPEYQSMYNSVIQEAIDQGIVVVSSAGNDSGTTKSYPAAYEGVISVGSIAVDAEKEYSTYGTTDASMKNNPEAQNRLFDTWIDILNSIDCSSARKLHVSFFSNYSDWVDIAAPGGNALEPSIYTPPQCNENYWFKYISMGGTSQAAPMVAGTVALMKQVNPNLSPEEITRIIKQTSDGVTYYGEDEYSYLKLPCGLLNARAAVDYAKDASSPNETVAAPVISVPDTHEDGAYKASGKSYVTISGSGKILYTDNGKDPKKYGKVYTVPLRMNDNEVKKIKAVSLVNGKYSEVAQFTGTFRVNLEGASFEDDAIVLQPGKSRKVNIVCTPTNAKVNFTYSVDNTDSFSVSSKGVVKAKKTAMRDSNGYVRVKDTYSGFEFTIPVKVAAASKTLVLPTNLPKQLAMNDSNPNIPASIDLKTLFTEANPESADLISFTCNRPSYVSFEDGKLYGQKKGKVKITAYLKDGSNRKKTFTMTIVKPVENLSVETDTGFTFDEDSVLYDSEQEDGLFAVIGNKKCKVTLYAVDGNEKLNGKSLKWESTNTDVLRVSKTGVVTPAPGAGISQSADIIATTTDGTNKSVRIRFRTVDPVTDVCLILREYEIDSDNNQIEETVRKEKYRSISEVIHRIKTPVWYVKYYSKFAKHAYEDGYRGSLAYGWNNAHKGEPTIFTLLKNEPFTIRNSNSKITHMNTVGSVSDYHIVYNLGTTTITYTARDGSGKKITINLKVKD